MNKDAIMNALRASYDKRYAIGDTEICILPREIVTGLLNYFYYENEKEQEKPKDKMEKCGSFTKKDINVAKHLFDLFWECSGDGILVVEDLIHSEKFQWTVSKELIAALEGWLGSYYANAEGCLPEDRPENFREKYNLNNIPFDKCLELFHELSHHLFDNK